MAIPVEIRQVKDQKHSWKNTLENLKWKRTRNRKEKQLKDLAMWEKRLQMPWNTYPVGKIKKNQKNDKKTKHSNFTKKARILKNTNTFDHQQLTNYRSTRAIKSR
ncbi:hypothetical protein HYE14_01495 [Mycoplasmopsis bovis]|nr:hypothetical protein [Mycoplasmopsis bovis]QQH25777.1 hypothetical protein HYE14_01495 [Mycoplasmopsis bovis]